VADSVLGVLRSLATFFASRNDDYEVPFIRGLNMRRVDKEERERSRVLSDAEIQKVWTAAGDAGFGAMLKICLLTGQRPSKVAEMKWTDVSDDGVWTIPLLPREKPNAGKLRLPLAMEIVQSQSRFVSSEFIFAGMATSSAAERKAELDTASDVSDWTVHDLRRTARALMGGRAGVPRDIAERVLGHTIGGVEKTYDRFSYGPQKADALRQLEALIKTILNSPPLAEDDNVDVPFPAAAAETA
jgi:integrase